jgi:hypothetical protein
MALPKFLYTPLGLIVIPFFVIFWTVYAVGIVVCATVSYITIAPFFGSKGGQKACMRIADFYWYHLCLFVEKWGQSKVKISGSDHDFH